MIAAALTIAIAAFVLAAVAYGEALAIRDRLDGFVKDVEQEFNDL